MSKRGVYYGGLHATTANNSIGRDCALRLLSSAPPADAADAADVG